MPQPIGDARLRGLAAVARSLGRSEQLVVMVELAAEGAVQALAAASVSISRLEPGTGTIRTLVNVGRLGPDEQRWPENEVYRVQDYQVGNVWAGMSAQFAAGELRIVIVSVDDPGADPVEVRALRSLHKVSSMSAPLVVDGQLWGELYATREHGDDPFDGTDEAYTEALAAILGGAISRALHVGSLERMAFLDPLTGLANRRALDDAAANTFDDISRRSGGRVSAVNLDVNGLKAVNDSAGHAAGDRLLTLVGGLLFKHFAHLRGALVARVGGDEFTVLVPGYDISSVVAAAEQVCKDARELPLGGLSCGIATTTDRRSDTGKQLLIAADVAQYEAKRQGLSTPVSAAYPFDYEAADAATGSSATPR